MRLHLDAIVRVGIDQVERDVFLPRNSVEELDRTSYQRQAQEPLPRWPLCHGITPPFAAPQSRRDRKAVLLASGEDRQNRLANAKKLSVAPAAC